jgi:CheY-like chemotaxis protein
MEDGGLNMVDKNLKILFVEDSEVQQELGVYRFEDLGFSNVVVVSNGLEAISHLEKNPVDLIISDWEMPEMDGIGFLIAVRLKPNFEKIPFIMMTADSSPAKEFMAQKEGATGFLLKPASDETLLKSIEKVFA